MNVFIIDDEENIRELIGLLINSYFPDFSIVGEASNVDGAVTKLKQLKNVDLVFSDLIMPNKIGFELFEEIENKNFEIIFISGYDQFALQAFTYSAIDYLLKPIDKFKFINAVNRATEQINFKSSKTILELGVNKLEIDQFTFSDNQRKYVLDYKEIAQIKGIQNGYTEIRTIKNVKYIISKSFKSLRNEILEREYLIAVSNSTVVNIFDLEYVEKGVLPFIKLKSSHEEIYLSRRRKKEVIKLIDKLVNKSL